MYSIMIDVIIVQSIFISLTSSVTAFNFLRCGLGAKKPDVIINRWSTTVYSEKNALAPCSFHAFWRSYSYGMSYYVVHITRIYHTAIS